MQVLPINSYKQNIAYTNRKNNPSFDGKFSFAMDKVPQKVLPNLQPSALSMWDRKTVCETFKNLMEEFKHIDKFKNSFKFQKLYELHKSLGLHSTLYVLGMEGSDALEYIMGANSLDKEVSLASNSRDYGNDIIIKNKGPWGFWKNLLGLSGKNEIVIEFKDKNGNNLEFSLDKKDDYVADSTSYYNGEFTEYKVSYYAYKDKVKKEILPQIELYLPPGV